MATEHDIADGITVRYVNHSQGDGYVREYGAIITGANVPTHPHDVHGNRLLIGRLTSSTTDGGGWVATCRGEHHVSGRTRDIAIARMLDLVRQDWDGGAA